MKNISSSHEYAMKQRIQIQLNGIIRQEIMKICVALNISYDDQMLNDFDFMIEHDGMDLGDITRNLVTSLDKWIEHPHYGLNKQE